MGNDDFRFKCLLIVLCGLAVGFGGWGLVRGCEALCYFVLMPTYRFVLAYSNAYGRVSLELISAAVLLGICLNYHEKTVSRLTHEFTVSCQRIEEKRAEFQNNLSMQSAKCVLHLDERNHIERELGQMKEKYRILKTENEGLWRELEMATEPEKLAKREEQVAQDKANEELLDHVGKTYWGNTG